MGRRVKVTRMKVDGLGLVSENTPSKLVHESESVKLSCKDKD